MTKAACIITNCRGGAPSGEPFCAKHRDKPAPPVVPGEAGEITHEERVEYEERILAVEMENERLKRALKPFAAKYILWNGQDRLYARDSQQIQHRLGDFRAAHNIIFGDVA